MAIHNYERGLEAVIERIQQSTISQRNKQLLAEFTDELILQGLSKPRIIRYLGTLLKLAREIKKDFDTVSEKDLKKIVSSLQQSNYASWTKRTYKIIVRKFFDWLSKEQGKTKITTWINAKISRSELKLLTSGDLLTQDEINLLVKVADHPRDKAMLAVFAESGARASEVGNCDIKSVLFDSYGVMLAVHGKTGTRHIRLVWSVPYLTAWLNVHPLRDDREAKLWINFRYKDNQDCLRYAAIRNLVKKYSRRAEITKKVYPHIFRHSRASYLAQHLTEFQMNQYFGWIQGSRMAATYIHMCDKNVDEAILAINGLKRQEEVAKDQPVAQNCPRCEAANPSENKFCHKCGGILNLQFALEVEEDRLKQEKLREKNDQLMNMLMQDKNVQELLLEKLTKLGSGRSLL